MADTEKKTVAILGAGIVGLTSAYVLLERGYSVTILARDLPWDVTSQHFASPWAGANWFSFAKEGREARWDEVTFRRWSALIDTLPRDVMTRIPFTDIGDVRARSDVWFADLVPDLTISDDGRVLSFSSFTISVPRYTAWLVSQLRGRGVRFLRVPTVSSLSAAAVLVPRAAVLVNATGLGARTLASDDAVHPIRGQTVLVRAPAVRRCVMKTGDPTLYVIPRAESGDVILGGTFAPHDARLSPDQHTAARIIDGCASLVPELVQHDGKVHVLSHNVGLRPARDGGARVQADSPITVDANGSGSRRRVGLVHAYGIGPAGYQASFGIAADVADLVDSHLAAAAAHL